MLQYWLFLAQNYPLVPFPGRGRVQKSTYLEDKAVRQHILAHAAPFLTANHMAARPSSDNTLPSMHWSNRRRCRPFTLVGAEGIGCGRCFHLETPCPPDSLPLPAFPPNTSTIHTSLDPIIHIGFASDPCFIDSRTEHALNLFQIYNATHKPCRCCTRRNGSANHQRRARLCGRRLRSLELPCGHTYPRCDPLTDQSRPGCRPPFQCPPNRHCCSTSNWCRSSAASTNSRLRVHPQSETEGQTASAQN